MLWKRKLYACAVLCVVLLFMIASRTVQKGVFLPSPADNTTARAHIRRPATVLPQGRTTRAPTRAKLCPCASCVAEAGLSTWFDQHFEPMRQPFLTAENNSIDPLALRWWLGLQHSANDFRTTEVIQNMFQVVSAPAGGRPAPSKNCRSCAVVGNSGNLLGSGYGSQIDSHSIVIRMNKAMTVGFEADVGNRTTHHLMYPESAVDLGPNVHLVLLPFKLRDLQWVASALSTGEIKVTYMRVKDRVKADRDKVIVINPAFMKYVHDKWTEHHGRYPSTGMVGIIFALHICDEVSVFGYGADKQGNWHHYWENNRNAGAFRKTGVHNADFETEVIQRLNTEGKIKLLGR